MEPIEVSETSAEQKQPPGIYPKEHIHYSKPDESLKSRILRLYGEDVSTHISLEKLRIKKATLLASLVFLLHCRDHNTIPRFLQILHHIRSRAANEILSTSQPRLTPGKNTTEQKRIGFHITCST
jgi:hypothetical protein